ISANGTTGFAPTVRSACSLLTAAVGADLYTTLFRNLVGDGLDSELLTFGRFESLIDDLESFLSRAGVALGDGGIDRIRAGSPFNASDRGAYREYYDEELRDLIGDSCRSLIGRFGYRF